MWTCWNDLSLNLYIMPPISHIVVISKNSFIESYKKGIKCIAIDTGDLASTLVDYQANYYNVFTSLKQIK